MNLIAWLWTISYRHNALLEEYLLAFNCLLVSTLGSLLYCIKAIYKNRCVHKKWDKDWETWYYLRPIAGAICGIIAYIFLKAGLVILSEEQVNDANEYTFLALAFIAGLNVDSFIVKIEAVGSSVFGVEKSNITNRIKKENKD